MAADGSATRIGANTWISGGILAAAIVGTATVVTMARDLQNGLTMLTLRADQTAAAVDRIQGDLSGLKWQLATTATDIWTGSDMRELALDIERELRKHIPGFVMPRVSHDAALHAGSPDH